MRRSDRRAPRTADGADTARPQFVDGRVGAGLGQLEADQPGVDRQHQRRLDPCRVEIVRATVVALGPLRPPRQCMATLLGQRGDSLGDGPVIPAVTVDEHHAGRPVGAADELDDHHRHHLETDREGAGEPRVLPGRAHRDRRTDHQAVGLVDRPAGEFLGDQRVGGEGEMWAVLFGRADGDQDDRRLHAVDGAFGSRGVGDLAPRGVAQSHVSPPRPPRSRCRCPPARADTPTPRVDRRCVAPPPLVLGGPRRRGT